MLAIEGSGLHLPAAALHSNSSLRWFGAVSDYATQGGLMVSLATGHRQSNSRPTLPLVVPLLLAAVVVVESLF